MIAVEALSYAVVVAACCAYLLWLIPGPCKCPKCAFHTNELNVARLKKAEELEEQRAKDEVLRHDYEHKGGSFLKGDPDRFNCHTETCERNKTTTRQPNDGT